jgi:hypothetical protein
MAPVTTQVASVNVSQDIKVSFVLILVLNQHLEEDAWENVRV